MIGTIKRVNCTNSAKNSNPPQMDLFKQDSWTDFDSPNKVGLRKVFDLCFQTSFWTPCNFESSCLPKLSKEPFAFFLFIKTLSSCTMTSPAQRGLPYWLPWLLELTSGIIEGFLGSVPTCEGSIPKMTNKLQLTSIPFDIILWPPRGERVF